MNKTLLKCDEGTTVIYGGYSGVAERIYREHIKITQKLVFMFYIYCNIEYRTSTTLIIHYDIISSALDALDYTILSFESLSSDHFASSVVH